MTRPTILIIPGSFAPASLYHDLTARLRKQSYPALVLELPSTQKRHPLPPATMHDDAACIRNVASALLAQGKDVVAVCHSYGGVPTSQGLTGLGERQGAEGSGVVRRIVYLTAVVPRVGESQVAAMNIPNGMIEAAVEGYMHLDPLQTAYGMENDLPTWEEAYEHVALLRHHSAISFTQPLSQAAYKHIPATYIVCDDDLIISPEVQRKFVAVLGDREGLDGDGDAGDAVQVINLHAGHCPMWSVPDELVQAILEAARREG